MASTFYSDAVTFLPQSPQRPTSSNNLKYFFHELSMSWDMKNITFSWKKLVDLFTLSQLSLIKERLIISAMLETIISLSLTLISNFSFIWEKKFTHLFLVFRQWPPVLLAWDMDGVAQTLTDVGNPCDPSLSICSPSKCWVLPSLTLSLYLIDESVQMIRLVIFM